VGFGRKPHVLAINVVIVRNNVNGIVDITTVITWFSKN